jgi:hypothetical protein
VKQAWLFSSLLMAVQNYVPLNLPLFANENVQKQKFSAIFASSCVSAMMVARMYARSSIRIFLANASKVARQVSRSL